MRWHNALFLILLDTCCLKHLFLWWLQTNALPALLGPRHSELTSAGSHFVLGPELGKGDSRGGVEGAVNGLSENLDDCSDSLVDTGVGGFCTRQAGLSAKTQVLGHSSGDERRAAQAGALVGKHRDGR